MRARPARSRRREHPRLLRCRGQLPRRSGLQGSGHSRPTAAVLRQIARLGRSVPFAGGRALAIAVYADGLDQPVRAQEAGYEGVACVDDAARALELYCDLWDATRLPWALRWCEGLVDFVLAMQEADGRWLN